MLAWLVAFLAIGAVGTWAARGYALRRNLLDAPGERRSHAVPTPRGGGIAIVAALLIAGMAWWGRSEGQLPLLANYLAGLVLVAGIGLADDHRPLSPWLRLAVHAVAAAGLGAGTWLSTGNAALALVAFALALVLVNVWNFMDGIDGLAASQALVVAAAVAMVAAGAWRWQALALVAALAGFLPFNFPKARIFLGDVGSGALGWTLATFVIAAMATAPGEGILWSLPLSAFLVDAGLTLARRVTRGEPWWRPHVQHAYQRWARRGGSHVPVTLAYAAWTVAGGAMLFGARGEELVVMFALTVAWYIAGAGAWWMLQRKYAALAVENME